MTLVAALAIVLLVVVVGLGTLRVNRWHQREAAFWDDVTFKVRLYPALDDQYRRVRTYVERRPCSTWEKLRGWKSPFERMGV